MQHCSSLLHYRRIWCDVVCCRTQEFENLSQFVLCRNKDNPVAFYVHVAVHLSNTDHINANEMQLFYVLYLVLKALHAVHKKIDSTRNDYGSRRYPNRSEDRHAIHNAPGKRPRYTNIHRHSTEKICTIPKINTYPSDLHSTIQDSA